MARYGMVIDLTRCMGCRACMEACKVENGTPESSFWMYVFRFEEGEYPNSKIRFLPRPCMHCDNPPCVPASKDGARIKWKNGLVATDFDLSTGDRSPEKACPYGVNYFNVDDPAQNLYLDWNSADLKGITGNITPAYWNPDVDKTFTWDEDPVKKERRIAGGGHKQNIYEKCTFCVHRIEKGLQNGLTPGVDDAATPACVVNCPVNAFTFGDLDDPNSNVSRLLQERSGEVFRLKEWAGTSPKVYYLGRYPDKNARLVEIVPVQEDVQALGDPALQGVVIPWK